MENAHYNRLQHIATMLFTIIMVIAILVIAKTFLYPIALAILLASLLFPIASFIESKGLPRIPSNFIAIVLGVILLGGAFLFMYSQLRDMVSDVPALKAKAFAKVDLLKHFIEGSFGVTSESQEQLLKKAIAGIFDGGSEKLGSLFSATTGSIVSLAIQPVYVFLMLYYRDKFREFFLRIAPPDSLESVKRVLDQVSNVTQHYMGGVLIVVLILCVLNSLGLYIIGIKHAIVLGVIAAICNFIPYFGTIIGFLFPLVFAMLTEDSPHYALAVVVMFFIIQFTENNILTPSIVGHNVRLNPLVIITSLIAGAMVWGVPGMLVIVPFMAVLRIIFENIERYKPYAFLLGIEGTEKHELSITKIKKFTSSILAKFKK